LKFANRQLQRQVDGATTIQAEIKKIKKEKQQVDKQLEMQSVALQAIKQENDELKKAVVYSLCECT